MSRSGCANRIVLLFEDLGSINLLLLLSHLGFCGASLLSFLTTGMETGSTKARSGTVGQGCKNTREWEKSVVSSFLIHRGEAFYSTPRLRDHSSSHFYMLGRLVTQHLSRLHSFVLVGTTFRQPFLHFAAFCFSIVFFPSFFPSISFHSLP